MDERYRAWKRLDPPKDDGRVITQAEADRAASIMQDGQAGEFWLFLRKKIEELLSEAEQRFVESPAKDFADYQQWYGRRQAYLTVLRMPELVMQDAKRTQRTIYTEEATR